MCILILIVLNVLLFFQQQEIRITDPLEYYSFASLTIIVCCSFQTWCYSHNYNLVKSYKAIKNAVKCKKIETATLPNSNPETPTIYNPTSTNTKFVEKKSLLIGAGHITLFALSALCFLLPPFVVKGIAKKNIQILNTNRGRIWVYLTQISLRFFYLNVFPSIVILSNSKMKKSIFRDIKDVFDKFKHWVVIKSYLFVVLLHSIVLEQKKIMEKNKIVSKILGILKIEP